MAGLDSAHPAHDLLIYLLYVAATAILLQTQEIPTSLSGEQAIMRNSDKVFSTEMNYYDRQLRLQAIEELQPEIIVYGNSWVNQFRAGMFAPYGFYNCANQSLKLNSAKSFITDAKRINPNLKIAIIMLHPWHFRAETHKLSAYRSTFQSFPKPSYNQYVRLLERKNLYEMLTRLDTTRTIGIRAIRLTRGMRLSDGSITFGSDHQRTSSKHAIKEGHLRTRLSYNIKKKKGYFPGMDQPIDERNIELIKSVTADLIAHGIAPIYLIPPIHDEFIAVMNGDSVAFQLWHELKTAEVQDRLNEIAPTYDYSEFSSFDGTTDMTYDGWHSTELAAHLMVEHMKEDDRSPDLIRSVPAIPLDTIQSWYPTPVYSYYD